jgi:hypothetical protein
VAPIDFAATPVVSTPPVCTAFCRLGSTPGCPNHGATGLLASGGCAMALAGEPGGTGDLAMCLQLCDVTADCTLKNASWFCKKDAATLAVFQHGVCFATSAITSP